MTKGKVGVLVTPTNDQMLLGLLQDIFDTCSIAEANGLRVVRTNETGQEYERGHAQGQKDLARLVQAYLRDPVAWALIEDRVIDARPMPPTEGKGGLLEMIGRLRRKLTGDPEAQDDLHTISVRLGLLEMAYTTNKAQLMQEARDRREVKAARVLARACHALKNTELASAVLTALHERWLKEWREALDKYDKVRG
jgi:hypothetical protein